ncbi:VRR-NUC domain-containing protein [Planktomarina sp.]|nr:VRR-NUC domain-containing protein [Planktomarina sp.]
MSVKVQKINSPCLGISNIVYGRRTNSNTRVEYLVDSGGDEELGYGIPEKVVLSRWKRKAHSRYRFGGIRLSPNVWRSINVALGSNYSDVFNMSIAQIDAKYAAASEALKSLNYPTMVGMKVVRLMEGLGLKRFNILMERHNDPSRAQRYGTPDLFLWAVAKSSEVMAYSRFVEVKKPDEPLSKDQISELHFLSSRLDLKARCFRLKERKTKHPMQLSALT